MIYNILNRAITITKFILADGYSMTDTKGAFNIFITRHKYTNNKVVVEVNDIMIFVDELTDDQLDEFEEAIKNKLIELVGLA